MRSGWRETRKHSSFPRSLFLNGFLTTFNPVAGKLVVACDFVRPRYGTAQTKTLSRAEIEHAAPGGSVRGERSRLYRSQILQENMRWNSYLVRKED